MLVDDSGFDGFEGDFAAAHAAGFTQDIGNIGFDGGFGQTHFRSDFSIRFGLAHQF